jgi:hypothetical protein
MTYVFNALRRGSMRMAGRPVRRVDVALVQLNDAIQ